MIIPTALLILLLAACSSGPSRPVSAPAGTGARENNAFDDHGFTPSKLLKTDVDTASEFAQHYALREMRRMMIKLYKRNPAFWRMHSASVDDAVDRVFPGDGYMTVFPEFTGLWGGDIVNLAFDPLFRGDRVRALTVGLMQMFLASYNNQTDFYLTTDLDPQSLYNSARNFERAAWLLNTRKRDDGKPFLVANSIKGDSINLSIERIFGKIIAIQDVMADIIADEQNRTIKNTVQSVVSFFLPI